ncbi:MAG: hypothetical protein ACE5WD_10040 [Candidatus Aminicenantia bacterium]
MSFVITMYVPEGVVMAADSRLTLTRSEEKNDKKIILQSVTSSDSNQKLFIIKEKFGLSIYGDAAIKNLPLAGYVNKFVEEKITEDTEITDIPNLILDFFGEPFKNPNVNFHVTGFKIENKISIPYVYVCNIQARNVNRPNYKNGRIEYGCTWGGEGDIIARLLFPCKLRNYRGDWEEVPHYPIAYQFFTLQDAIDFAIYAVRTTIDTIRFQPRPKTIGGPIDVLIIKPDLRPQWIQKKEYRGI